MASGAISQILAAASVTFCAALAQADWATDSGSPTILLSGAGDQAQPKVEPDTTGGFYVAHYDSNGGGYDMALARFDANANLLWRVVVANLAQSSTEDYGFSVDSTGNAYLSFRDDRTPMVQITAAKVALNGTLPWGSGGVQLTANTSDLSHSPRARVLANGDVAVGWSQSNKATVNLVSPAGAKRWILPYTMTDGTAASYILSDIQPSGASDLLVSAVRYTTFTGVKYQQVQKLSSAGATLFPGTAVAVHTSGSLQIGNYPPFESDGAGGAIFCWYATSPLQCYVQHVSSTGMRLFGTGGVGVTTTTTQERVSPRMAFDAAANRIYVAWSEHTPNTSIYGAGAQSFDAATGARQWTNNGFMFAPLETVYSYTWAMASMTPDGPNFGAVRSTSFIDNTLMALGATATAETRWIPAATPVAASQATLFRNTTTRIDDSGTVIVWQGADSDGGAILAARLGDNGALGAGPPAGNPADLDGDGVVGGADLAMLLGAFGASGPGDLDGDGTVGGADLAALLAAFGS